ncbi:MAG: glycosyltransferase [Caldilineaceae bacterium]
MNQSRSANPYVSIIMPTYNGARFLGAALESIRRQDYAYSALELIVVDDGSTDETGEILASFQQSWLGQVALLNHPGRKNRGISESYRLAIAHAKGDLIAFLEHDDFWLDNKISEQIKIFEAYPEVGVVFSDVYPCDVHGAISAYPFRGIVNRPIADKPFDDAFWRLIWGNFILTFSNFMIRRNLFDVSDILLEPKGFQEWMLLLRMAKRCYFFHCSSTKTFWRQNEHSYHRRLGRLPDYKRKRLSIVRQMMDEDCPTGLLRQPIIRTIYRYAALSRHLIARNRPIHIF